MSVGKGILDALTGPGVHSELDNIARLSTGYERSSLFSSLIACEVWGCYIHNGPITYSGDVNEVSAYSMRPVRLKIYPQRVK